MDPKSIIRIDEERMNGASAADILGALTQALGDEQGAEAFKTYCNTPMPDGRKRSEVNMGDPDEWHA